MSAELAFSLPVRVYYEDTDAGGVVYHSNYIQFMERARTEFLRSFGFSQQVLHTECRLFVVADCSVKFRRPARLDDLLQVTAELESVGKVRLVFKQRILRDDELLCEGRFVIGSVHSETMRPTAIPKALKNAIWPEGKA